MLGMIGDLMTLSFFKTRRIAITVKIVTVMSLLCCVLAVEAAVYKWTDSQGKVHYSDQKKDEKASEQKVSVGSMPKAPEVKKLQAIKYKNFNPTKSLAVTEVEFVLPEYDQSRKNGVALHFGGDCVSPSFMTIDEFQRRFRKNFNSPEEFQRLATRTLSSYGYRNSYFKPIDPNRKTKGNEGYVLRIDIVNIKINACVPTLREPYKAGMLDGFSFYSYERSNVWLRLKWSLETYEEQIFASGVTEGASSDIDGRDATINYTLDAAFVNGVTNIIANEDFVRLTDPQYVAPFISH
jgi:Domain of unknown function (DUF4124)